MFLFVLVIPTIIISVTELLQFGASAAGTLVLSVLNRTVGLCLTGCSLVFQSALVSFAIFNIVCSQARSVTCLNSSITSFGARTPSAKVTPNEFEFWLGIPFQDLVNPLAGHLTRSELPLSVATWRQNHPFLSQLILSFNIRSLDVKNATAPRLPVLVVCLLTIFECISDILGFPFVLVSEIFCYALRFQQPLLML